MASVLLLFWSQFSKQCFMVLPSIPRGVTKSVYVAQHREMRAELTWNTTTSQSFLASLHFISNILVSSRMSIVVCLLNLIPSSPLPPLLLDCESPLTTNTPFSLSCRCGTTQVIRENRGDRARVQCWRYLQSIIVWNVKLLGEHSSFEK